MTQCYMVVLQGQGDTMIYFVNKATWDWIHTEEVAPPERQIMKLLDPAQMMGHPYTIDEAVEETTRWKGSSPDNDRAMGISGDYGKDVYFSFKEAMKAAKTLNLDVIEEYEGYLY